LGSRLGYKKVFGGFERGKKKSINLKLKRECGKGGNGRRLSQNKYAMGVSAHVFGSGGNSFRPGGGKWPEEEKRQKKK